MKKFVEDKHVVSLFPIVTTRSTGAVLENAFGLAVQQTCSSGRRPGDRYDQPRQVDGVLFFRDPLSAHPHDDDIKALMRICDVTASRRPTTRRAAASSTTSRPSPPGAPTTPRARRPGRRRPPRGRHRRRRALQGRPGEVVAGPVGAPTPVRRGARPPPPLLPVRHNDRWRALGRTPRVSDILRTARCAQQQKMAMESGSAASQYGRNRQ